jgi:hypothetical protein
MLTAVAASLLIALPAVAKDATAEAPAVKELRGKAGFQFQYPNGWVTGFVSALPSIALPCMSTVMPSVPSFMQHPKDMLAGSAVHTCGVMQNRKNQSGALALVGDFKNFDTASVLKADLSRLKLPPETGACRELVTIETVCCTTRYHCHHHLGIWTRVPLFLPTDAAFVPDIAGEKGDVRALVRALIDEARSTVRLAPIQQRLLLWLGLLCAIPKGW